MPNRFLICAAPPMNISSASAPASCASSAEPKRACSAASSRILGLRQARSRGRFVEQYIQRRNRGVPFDESWYLTQPPARNFVETPDLGRHAGTMVIDQQIPGSGMHGE